MGVFGIHATDGAVEHVGADREAHPVTRLKPGTHGVRTALHERPRRLRSTGEQRVRHTTLVAVVRHDGGRAAPFAGDVACHRSASVPKGDPLSHLHLLGRRETSLCHDDMPSHHLGVVQSAMEACMRQNILCAQGAWVMVARNHIWVQPPRFPHDPGPVLCPGDLDTARTAPSSALPGSELQQRHALALGLRIPLNRALRHRQTPMAGGFVGG
jgi:hypothetical protein